MDKLCPLKFNNVTLDKDGYAFSEDSCFCERIRCAWWINGWTIENLPIECCALEYMAMKNSEGKYLV